MGWGQALLLWELALLFVSVFGCLDLGCIPF